VLRAPRARVAGRARQLQGGGSGPIAPTHTQAAASTQWPRTRELLCYALMCEGGGRLACASQVGSAAELSRLRGWHLFGACGNSPGVRGAPPAERSGFTRPSSARVNAAAERPCVREAATGSSSSVARGMPQPDQPAAAAQPRGAMAPQKRNLTV
jgi:hypothetical protein